MRKNRFSDQQIALALQQVEHGASVAEICRKLGIREQTFYRWKKKFGEMAPSRVGNLVLPGRAAIDLSAASIFTKIDRVVQLLVLAEPTPRWRADVDW